MDKLTITTRYGCSGSCGGDISEAQFNAGQKVCKDRDCDCYGQPCAKSV